MLILGLATVSLMVSLLAIVTCGPLACFGGALGGVAALLGFRALRVLPESDIDRPVALIGTIFGGIGAFVGFGYSFLFSCFIFAYIAFVALLVAAGP
jgi:hypothetical protein